MSEISNLPFLPVTLEEALSVARDPYCGHGKIEILPKVVVNGLRDMAVSHTPGVGKVVQHILAHPDMLHEQTAKDNMIALVTDGTAVLGFGNAGPHAGMPVMEGKAVMFKLLAGIDCMPLCVSSRGPSHLVDIITALEPSFGGFNLEDVAAPGCFEVMRELDGGLEVPALHDDQYGTATVVTAGVLNSMKLLGRRPQDIRAVVNGVGAAGTATIQLLQEIGIGDIIALDRQGILRSGDDHAFDHLRDVAAKTNAGRISGGLADAMKGADLFVGLSGPRLVTAAMVRSMNKDPIVFGLANPDPEIMPHEATAAGAAITASGRFDFPNQCNNVLAFPGLMRGALDTRARRISVGMCLAAAKAIADCIEADTLGTKNILPSPLDPDVHPMVAEAVARASMAEGLARRFAAPGAVERRCRDLRTTVQARQRELIKFEKPVITQ